MTVDVAGAGEHLAEALEALDRLEHGLNASSEYHATAEEHYFARKLALEVACDVRAGVEKALHDLSLCGPEHRLMPGPRLRREMCLPE